MTIYNTHQELINKVKDNNCQKSYKKLLTEYEPLIKKLSLDFKTKYKNTPVELEDIKNVMFFYFFKLTKEYDLTKNKSFPLYIKEFLFYKTSTWIRSYVTLNNQVLNYSNNDVEELNVNDKDRNIFDLDLLNPENTPTLSLIEEKVIQYLIEGWSIKEISEKTNIKQKTLYAAKARAISKMKKSVTKK